jgi:hypothetical protein
MTPCSVCHRPIADLVYGFNDEWQCDENCAAEAINRRTDGTKETVHERPQPE